MGEWGVGIGEIIGKLGNSKISQSRNTRTFRLQLRVQMLDQTIR